MIQEANLQWAHLDTDSGLIMPWLTLPTLQWLKTQKIRQWNIFEYGSGYSTIWFRANCALVKSVDSSESWALAMGAWLARSKDIYVRTVNNGSEFDCIIVDGDYREECVKYCIDFIKKGGYLIIDNWASEDFDPKLVEELLKDWPITLYKQPNHTSWQTAVLIKP